jgi:hypothetical protein
MARIITVLFIFSFSVVNAQTWITLKNTQIQFSDFHSSSSIKWQDYSFEFFLKVDRLLAVDKNLSDDFRNILSKNPEIFEDLFKNAYNVTDKNDLRYAKNGKGVVTLDSLALNIDFKSTVIITGRDIMHGHKESIWRLSNPPGTYELGGWYIKIVFSGKGKNRKYIITDKDHMVI